MLDNIKIENQYQLTRNDVTNVNVKSNFKQNSRYIAVPTCSTKKVILKLSRPATLLKRRLRHWCFYLNFWKYLTIQLGKTKFYSIQHKNLLK